MVVSDSTLARVLKWLRLGESQKFESHDLLRRCLSHRGPPLRKPGAGTAGGAEELKEYYPKRRRRRNTSCWIVTTDLELALEEIREAAHQRWQIENNVFKRISRLSGTKQLFAALRAGIKDTWRNVFSRIAEVLYQLPCAFESMT